MKTIGNSGERLRALRKAQNMPILVLAHKAGISQQYIWLWECHNLPPKRSTAQRIADVLGVPLETLLQEEVSE